MLIRLDADRWMLDTKPYPDLTARFTGATDRLLSYRPADSTRPKTFIPRLRLARECLWRDAHLGARLDGASLQPIAIVKSDQESTRGCVRLRRQRKWDGKWRVVFTEESALRKSFLLWKILTWGALLFNTPPTPGLQLCSNTRRGKPRCPCSASKPRTWRLTAVVGCPLVSSAPFAPPSMSDEHVHDQAKQMMAKVRIVVSSPPPSA